MKRILSILLLLCLASPAVAQNIITGLVTVTNAAGTVNGNGITVNGNFRLCTNNVITPASQIATGTNIVSATSNLFAAYVVTRESGLSISKSSTNGMFFKGNPGAALTITLGGSWGTVSFTTNPITTSTFVQVPISNAGNYERTNVESGLVDYANDNKATNTIAGNAPIFVNFASLTNANTFTKSNNFTGAGAINGNVGNLTNGTWTNPSFTNGQNFGNPFRSPGTGTGSEQFGLGASASGNGTVAFGDGANASATAATAIGNSAHAAGASDTVIGNGAIGGVDGGETAIGQNSLANASSATAIGVGAVATGISSSALGQVATASFDNSTAIGQNATTTKTNQIALGIASGSVWIPSSLQVDGSISNATFAGSVTLNNTIAYTRKNITTLVNGSPNLVSTSTNLFLKLSGPTGAFTVNAMDGGSDGRVVILYNVTGQTMTIANNSGALGVAANRILTGTGADVVGVYAATLIYDSAQSLWILVSKN